MQRKVKAISIARLVHQTPEESSASSPPSSSSRVPISSAAAHHTFAQRRRISALLCVHVFTTSSWFIHESSSWKRENTHHLILRSSVSTPWPIRCWLEAWSYCSSHFLADIEARWLYMRECSVCALRLLAVRWFRSCCQLWKITPSWFRNTRTVQVDRLLFSI